MNNQVSSETLIQIEQEKTRRNIITVVIISLTIFMVISCCCGSAVIMSYMDYVFGDDSNYDYYDDYSID